MKPRNYLKIRPPLHGMAIDSSWRTVDLCKAYSWPVGMPGGGKIGILELGGGWILSDIEIANRMQGIPVTGISVTDISCDGVTNNNRNTRDPASGEVALDIQTNMASYFVATGKLPTINMYWDSGNFARVINRAVADGCAVICISWGLAELFWLAADRVELQAACLAAEIAGALIFVASGDNDSNDGTYQSTVDCPASCPNVIGLGGTKKLANVAPALEQVWNNNPGYAGGEGTGGGWSQVWGVQPWQKGAPAGGGRMVPDMAANADPTTGYKVVLGGVTQVFGGTSACPGVFGGLFASFGPRGVCKGARAKLWGLGQTCFNDITEGNNGLCLAVPGPDACSGIGTPIGTRIAALFGAHPAYQPHFDIRYPGQPA